MTTLMTRNRICEHLGKYVFDKIWNDPYTEYRSFTVPECLTEVAAAGIFFGRYSKVQLPSSVPYKTSSRLYFYVYSIPADQIRNLRLNVLEWNRLDQYCTDNLIDLEFFSDTGRKAIRNSVFIRQADKADCILIAIERSSFQTCFGDKAQPTARYYFGKYFDSDLTPSVKYEDFKLSSFDVPSNQVGTKYDPISKTGVPTYTLYNGRLLAGDYMNAMATGALIEKVYDGNIVGTIDVECDGEKANAPLYPGVDTKWRVLVHIPKTINKDHVIITPNTCDIYMVPTKMSSSTGVAATSGIYLFQCGRAEHFHQLTHNDFSIDLDWLKEIAEENGFASFYLKVFVRIHSKSKKAIRDASYLNVLYLHNDEEIVNFLIDKSDYPMEFWMAKNLEDGLYQQMLIKRRNVAPSATDQCSSCANYDNCSLKPLTDKTCSTYAHTSIDTYIDAIGYYHTLALLGKHVTHFEVVDDTLGPKYKKNDKGEYVKVEDGGPGVNEFVVHAPLALVDLTYRDFKAVVYVNGLRIDSSLISTKDGPNLCNQHHREITFTPDADWWTNVTIDNYADTIRVCLDDEVKLNVGDKVVIELYDDRLYTTYNSYIKVAGEELKIELHSADGWKVFKIVDHTDRKDYIYYPVENPGEFDETTNTLTVSDELNGEKILVVESPIVLENYGERDIDHVSTEYLGGNIYDSATDTYHHPLDSEVVFMNGHRLTRGLDYTIEGYNGDDESIPECKLYLQNVSYLKQHTEYQMLRTSMSTLSHQRGFLRGKIVQWNHQNPFWFDELSVMTIGGKVCSNLSHQLGTITITDGEHDNGLPYEFTMNVSSKIKKLIGDHGEDTDRTRIEAIKAYFDSKYKKPDYITIVKKAHKIYSLYLEQIISTYVTDPSFMFYSVGEQVAKKAGNLEPGTLVTVDNFEEQFSGFSDWKLRDVAYNLSEEDLKYTDVYPIFNRLKTINRTEYNKITALAKLLSPSDKYKHKDAANVK